MRLSCALLITACLIIYLTPIFSQNAELDSLQNILKHSKEDQNKADLLSDLSLKLAGKNPTNALEYANRGLVLSKELGYIKGVADAYRSIGQVNYLGGKYEDAKIHFRNAMFNYDAIANKKMLATSLNDLGIIYTVTGVLDTAEIYFNKTLILGEELNDTTRLSSANANLASIYNRRGEPEKAISAYKKLLVFDSLSNQIAYYVEDLGNIATCYSALDKNEEAIKYALRSISIADSLDIKGASISSLSVIGNVYRKIGDLKSSEHYLKLLVAASKELGNLGIIGQAYNSLNLTYLAKRDLNMALSCLDSALLYIAPDLKYRILSNKALLYTEHLNLPDSALFYYDESLNAIPDYFDSIHKVGPLIGKGILLNKIGRSKEAQSAIEKGLAISPDLASVEFADRKRAMKDLANALNDIGKEKLAFGFLNKAVLLQDSLLQIDQDAQAKLLDYEKQVRHFQIKEQELEIKEKELKLENRFYLLLTFGVIAFLGGIFTLILFKLNSKLKLANQALRNLSNELHHRVKNDFQSIASMIFVHQNSLSDNKVKEALLNVRSRILAMGQIHKLFYSEGKYINFGLSNYLFELIKHNKKGITAKNKNIIVRSDLNIPESLELKLSFEEAKQLGVIINELVTNSLKHALLNHPSPEIKLEAFSDESTKKLKVIVRDNGVGNTLSKKINVDHGFGLKMIRNICDQLGWDFELSSNSNGSTAMVILNNHLK